MKTARNAFGKPYECKQAWPEDCFVQCGDTGIVLGKGSFNKVMKAENTLKEFAEEAADPDTYVTAFFEAFPKPPVKTFIRGEGKTVEEAEANAFQQYQKFAACDHSMGFERRTYTNGAGFCLGCGMLQSDVFLPSSLCCVCGIPTNWTSDINNNHYCEVHSSQMPEDKKDSFHKMMDRYKKRKKTT